MSEDDNSERLAALDARIQALKGGKEAKSHMDDHHAQAHLAWRMVVELVVGLGIGFGIGYGLDQLFGTAPWLMIVFVFLGLAAGIKTMMRSAQEIQAKQVAEAAAQKKEGHDGD